MAIFFLLSLTLLLPFTNSNLTLGAFNIQTFGNSKYSNLTLRSYLIKIVTQYDIILIQEIKDKSEKMIYKFLADCQKERNFSMVLSPRLGATSYKEQYAVFYDDTIVRIEKNITYDDKDKIFARSPLIVHITALNAEKSTSQNANNGKSLTLIGVHIDPDEVVAELDGLVSAYQWAVGQSYPSNAMLMGDFNADCSYLSAKKSRSLLMYKDKKFKWIIDEDSTVADTDCAYDRFIAVGNVAFDKTQIDTFDKRLGMSNEMARKVSDHYPIQTVWVYPESGDRGNDSNNSVNRPILELENMILCVKGLLMKVGWKEDDVNDWIGTRSCVLAVIVVVVIRRVVQWL